MLRGMWLLSLWSARRRSGGEVWLLFVGADPAHRRGTAEAQPCSSSSCCISCLQRLAGKHLERLLVVLSVWIIQKAKNSHERFSNKDKQGQILSLSSSLV